MKPTEIPESYNECLEILCYNCPLYNNYRGGSCKRIRENIYMYYSRCEVHHETN